MQPNTFQLAHSVGLKISTFYEFSRREFSAISDQIQGVRRGEKALKPKRLEAPTHAHIVGSQNIAGPL